MCSRILLKVCEPVFHLLNLPNLEDYPHPINQFLVMPTSSYRNFGGKRPNHKQQKGTQESKTSCRNGFQGKKNKEYQQKKRKTPTTTSPESNLKSESRDLINPPLPILVEDSISEAQPAKTAALHKRWKAEDKTILHREKLITRQKQRCRDVGLIAFGFALKEAQVDAIWTLFYAKKDLLLLAKTGFGKSLIFQLIPFFVEPSGVVIILIPLKLLQAKQNTMINQIAQGKAIALTGENNQKDVQKSITSQNYTHVFTSPEITLSKKFKINVLDNPRFSNRLLLLAIDKIHLVEKWGKAF